jgi:hypothetical protein
MELGVSRNFEVLATAIFAQRSGIQMPIRELQPLGMKICATGELKCTIFQHFFRFRQQRQSIYAPSWIKS